MFTSELKHGNVQKIVADPTSGKVHLITPIFPLGKVTNHKELFRRWGVTGVAEKVYNHLQRAIGKADLTVMKSLDNHFPHPTKEGADQWENYTYQSNYSIGKLAHVFKNPDRDNVMWGAYDVTDDVGKQVVLEYMDSYNKGLVPLYTSSQIVNSASENPYSIENFDLMHTTLTDDPSFGKELTKVGAVCIGNTQQCTVQIHTASNLEPTRVFVHDNVVDIFHKTCPFCVGTALRELFKKNSFLKLNQASNIKMTAKPEEEKKDDTKIILPDADQQKNNGSINPDELANLVDKKVNEAFEKSNVKLSEEKEKPEEEKPAEEPTTEAKSKKPEPIAAENLKPYDIESDPKYQKLMKKVETLSNQLEKSKVDSEKLKSLESENNFNKIGTLLAGYEGNFVDPSTKKPDPKKFDAAFDFLTKTNWSMDDIKIVLETLSPYGSTQRASEAPQQEESIIQKASNRGTPQIDAAFEGKRKEDTHSASNTKRAVSGLSLVDSVGRLNSA